MLLIRWSDGTFDFDGAAYVFLSPLQPDASGLVSAADADLKLQSLFENADELFGERVAPLFDITGNGLPEIRVKSSVESNFTTIIGGEVLMHVFAGGDSNFADAGEFLLAIVTTAEFDPWQNVTGDVTGDGAVTQADMDIILANISKEGADLTTRDGNLNGDGVIDGLDLAIAMDHFGTQLIDVTWGAGGELISPGDGGADLLCVWSDYRYGTASNIGGSFLLRLRLAAMVRTFRGIMPMKIIRLGS